MSVIERDTVQTENIAGEPLLLISETAAERLSKLREEKELGDNYALRVFVAGGGCSGLQYGMTFDDEVREGDAQFNAHGMRVLVDPVSTGYLQGATVDYVDTLMGGGFKIDNPNAASGCGCGKSFRSKEDGGEEEADEEAAGGCSSCSSY
jgi:iron-sulfur cluster assembly accessory protein